MADIDPKELLVKNKSLVVLYALALVPVILWFVLVGGGAKAEFEGNARKLRTSERSIKQIIGRINNDNPAERPLTAQHIDAFKAQHNKLGEQVRDLKKVVNDRDQVLEGWFDAPLTKNLAKDKEPNPNDYITLYRTQLEALVKEYEALVVPEGGGVPVIWNTEPPRNQLRLWQKRFWVQKYLLQAIKEGTEDSVKAGKVGGRMLEAPRFTDMSRSGSGKPDPNAAVERIGVSLAITCRFPDLSRIVERILAQPITYQVLRIQVAKTQFMIENTEFELRIDGRDTTFNDPYYTGELADQAAFKGEDQLDEYIPEPPVQVQLELEVLDFKVELPPEPAPEEGAGDGEAPADGGGEEGN